MKNIFLKLAYVILGISFLNFIKYFILLVYFFTDKNFYKGTFDDNDSFLINEKLLYMQLIPLTLYLAAVVFLIFIYKKALSVIELIIIVIITIYLNKIIDFRGLFFFITNHRIRLYYAILISLLIILVTFRFIKFLATKREEN